MSKRTREEPAARKSQVLAAALAHAEAVGFQNMTRASVAKAAKVSDGLISHYFGTMPQLRRAVMRSAVVCNNLAVVGQGLVARDPQAMKAPDWLRDSAVRSLMVRGAVVV